MIDSLSPVYLFEKSHSQIEQAESVEAALALMRENYELDNLTYHLSQTVISKVDSLYVRTTYPAAWVGRYLMRNYMAIDPVVVEGFERSLPFFWEELRITEAAVNFLQDAKDHGLGGNGYSVPVTDKFARRALVSFNGSKENWREFVANFRNDWIELSHRIHAKAMRELYGEDDPVPVLSPRELECLHWSALGKDHKAVAIILGISEHTARDYLKSARIKLGCANIAQAIAKALKLRVISP
ncbi:LuxR family transcriptional regulator [Rhizobium sp. FKY42]|uniref:helix-turn-helix transcriptional regulator n=1 Tax=Rhizobium sp. FKY42 TaxID=2562310 RepID=UPI0010C0B268|nr:LuxR family transcriptional regulator [Rhizobium sp. FKY42]